ncbi:MAG: imidazole glycerol phosphate synthase subunit HisH [Deltaproteobacteria bacterium]|jgi:glutamine amidotransferase|nr:imidazole glycerol phosphate synthase subunit HisH [Deltaproteobacteria bacterium]
MKDNFLAIIEYKAGNQTSVHRALAQLNIPAKVSDDFIVLQKAKGIIFPGVGAAGQAMEVLRFSGMDHIIIELINSGKPFLGICLGCQIMLDESEENNTNTLGVFRGKNVRFDSSRLDEDERPIRVPHIGWNRVETAYDFPLWEGIGQEDQFYFVHSYYPVPSRELVLGTTYHGGTFASVFGTDGVWAVQFHPEKSGKVGLRLLSNFYKYSLNK